MALLLHLPFLSVGSSSTQDVSGKGNHGTLSPGSGDPTSVVGPVPSMRALRLSPSGQESYVSCPFGASPQNTFTVSMWLRLATINDRNAIWSVASDPVDASSPWLEFSATQLILSTPGLVRARAYLPQGHDLTKWHHYSWVRAGLNNSLAYLDSEPLETETPSDIVMATTRPTLIGIRYATSDAPHLASVGDFADVRVYDAPVGRSAVRRDFCEIFRGNSRLSGAVLR